MSICATCLAFQRGSSLSWDGPVTSYGTKPSLQTSTGDPLHQISRRALNHSSSDLEWIWWCDPCLWPIEWLMTCLMELLEQGSHQIHSRSELLWLRSSRSEEGIQYFLQYSLQYYHITLSSNVSSPVSSTCLKWWLGPIWGVRPISMLPHGSNNSMKQVISHFNESHTRVTSYSL